MDWWTLPLDEGRYKRAIKSVKLVQGTLDRENCTAQFKGSAKVPYTTTLSECTCVDFDRNGAPCKHMIRLAVELGLIGAPDTPPSNRSIGAIVDVIESLERAEQLLLLSILDSGAEYPFDKAMRRLQDVSLVQLQSLPSPSFESVGREYLGNKLDENKILGYPHDADAPELARWCSANNITPQGLGIEIVQAQPAPDVACNAQAIATFLRRKFMTVLHTVGGEMYEAPCDAVFDEFSRDSATGSVRWFFPDDDCTALLKSCHYLISGRSLPTRPNA